MHTNLFKFSVVALVLGSVACSGGSDYPDENGHGGRQGSGGATGGSPGSGGATAGGTSNGGQAPGSGGSSNSGGSGNGGNTNSVGGSSNGGSTAKGGSGNGGNTNSVGGSSNGGSSNGGRSGNGGSAAGGTSNGGSGSGGKTANGGNPSGGASNGGSGNGGQTANGGSASGGAAAGGKTGSGGAGSGGAGTGGSGTGGGSSVNCSAAALSGGTAHCSSNASGSVGSYTWTIWSSGTGGCLTTYNSGAAFKASWNNSGDFLARVGLQWNETKTYDQYGTVGADYAYTKTGSGGGYSFIGIYGWSNSPLVEYYIVDDWFGSGPPTGGGTKKGTLDIDGGTYDIYTHTQNNQPSIHGTATFPQFFSVRRIARQCGHISISEHFKKWASLGMTLGKMYEAKLLVEAGGGSGSIDYKLATVTSQ